MMLQPSQAIERPQGASKDKAVTVHLQSGTFYLHEDLRSPKKGRSTYVRTFPILCPSGIYAGVQLSSSWGRKAGLGCFSRDGCKASWRDGSVSLSLGNLWTRSRGFLFLGRC